ncbi:MAG TPA: hypothetical protein VFK87_00185, partial [Steroidobacteraceae bacterium]|nr:hypothetical protein [Steroidobacteraceae bacterium]
MPLASLCCPGQLAAGGVASLLALAVLGLAAGRSAAGSRIVYGACMLVCAALAAVALAALLAGGTHAAPLELGVGLPLGRTLLGFDPLSAAFAVIINTAAAIVSAFEVGYGAHEREPVRVVPLYPAFIAA